MTKKEKLYTTAFQELSEIVQTLESNNINIDELSGKLKEAQELLAICKEKLTSTETEVSKILDEINKAEGDEEK